MTTTGTIPDRLEQREPPPRFADDEIERLLDLISAYQKMAMARWDHGLDDTEFGAIMDTIEARAKRALDAARAVGGHA